MTLFRHFRLALLTSASAFAVWVTACRIENEDDSNGCAPTGSNAPTSAEDAAVPSGNPDSGNDSDAGGGNDSGLDEPPSPDFLAIPAGDDIVRVTASGTNWGNDDVNCKGITSDAYFSIASQRAFLMFNDDCTGGARGPLAQTVVSSGLKPGVYDIAEEDAAIGQISLTPEDERPSNESRLTGKLWVRTAVDEGDFSLLEASYYGTANWNTSSDDTSEVLVKVAFRVRVRNIERP